MGGHRWRVQCKPGQLVVGIDPGEAAGAVVVLSTDDHGRPRLVRTASWHKLRRKAGPVWRVSSCLRPDVHEVPHFQECLRSVVPAAASAVAVEGLFVPNRPAKGLLVLAEAAGVALGVVRHLALPEPLRPRFYDWAQRVTGLPRGSRRKAAEDWIARAWEETGQDVAWGLRGPAVSDATGHEVDAMGIALYAAGGQLADV